MKISRKERQKFALEIFQMPSRIRGWKIIEVLLALSLLITSIAGLFALYAAYSG